MKNHLNHLPIIFCKSKDINSPKIPEHIKEWCLTLKFLGLFVSKEEKYLFRACLNLFKNQSLRKYEAEVYLDKSLVFQLNLKLCQFIHIKAIEEKIIDKNLPINAFSVFLTKRGIEIYYYVMETLIDSTGFKVFSSYLNPKCSKMRVAFTAHSLINGIFGSINPRNKNSERVSRCTIEPDTDIGYFDAFGMYAMRKEYPLIQYKGQEFIKIYELRIVHFNENNFTQISTPVLLGYCPIERDVKTGLIIAKTFLSVGMDNTPEGDYIKSLNNSNLNKKLNDINVYKIFDDPELSDLLVEKFKLIDEELQSSLLKVSVFL